MVCVVCLWRRFAEVRIVNTAAMVATSTVKVKGSEGIWEPAERRAETAGIDKGIRSAGRGFQACVPGCPTGVQQEQGDDLRHPLPYFTAKLPVGPFQRNETKAISA